MINRLDIYNQQKGLFRTNLGLKRYVGIITFLLLFSQQVMAQKEKSVNYLPIIQWISHDSDTATVDGTSFTMNVNVTCKKDLEEVKIFLNGKLIKTINDFIVIHGLYGKVSKRDIYEVIDLTTGVNLIEIWVKNKQGVSTHDNMIVYSKGIASN